jgi:hypothetical protein
MSWIVENMLRNFRQIDKTSENAGKLIIQHNTPKKDKTVLKRKIMWLLTSFEHLRDNDIELVNTIWIDEMENLVASPKHLTWEDFLKVHHKLSRADSICRYRRRLQQLYPSLRGKTYKHRKAKEQEAKEELGYKNEPTP